MAGNTRSIDICVCTFRRPELADTLRSIAAMDRPAGFEIGVVVADNDDQPSAQPLVKALAQELKLPIRYRHAPARNISIARNACLDASVSDLVAFIDDDETASVRWLAELVATAEASGATAVLGPVRARYGSDAPAWMRKGDFHSTLPVWVRGEIRTGYTCNVLLRTSEASLRGRRFSLARGQTGGEDTEFFDTMVRDGGRIAFAPDALVEEVVPHARAAFDWLRRRRFRFGQTHGHLIGHGASGIRRVAQVGLASAKAAYCFAMAALTAISPVRRNRSVLRGIMHVGVVSGLVGVREIRQYGLSSPQQGGKHAA
ncbi:glycosyltransferase family 2 protein [Mesorhizobium sp. M4B.F.Ca.ET.215.01.1.1]|uniref:glycosyltransferase n=1 Tax=unclassified Mesorhizobium TaxID=325217 RepID=UPI000FC9C747|nr:MULTISPECIES: glycosyltransferase family 2 protein [unclassified Mesorhizobium]RUW20442.1 glycosyltransferase family 2 protein [Mesorhizobium sp. M4B.F.Ca.ET.013.02.1.1]RVD45266.1 glycosyltransferase family 2 protein [Mesorhizobium sp. M4B.F.Ca.ET.019.03.1.1]TGQ15391.1 glycosyltransferase family 2 protein [Mesorhizobium sp. M4B.F.Ca.ET.215.01.1.1]TGQ48400.1 glycosyltransferase family 2 protein [Mesorhizobium sp. M00.F.Ca.ET.220.01.1.1]TGR11455.1 glycosyltransferase family 2 protein [Mesorhi